jgi:hypothetical protein
MFDLRWHLQSHIDEVFARIQKSSPYPRWIYMRFIRVGNKCYFLTTLLKHLGWEKVHLTFLRLIEFLWVYNTLWFPKEGVEIHNDDARKSLSLNYPWSGERYPVYEPTDIWVCEKLKRKYHSSLDSAQKKR